MTIFTRPSTTHCALAAALLLCGSAQAQTLRSWMSPDVGAAWSAGYKGQGTTITVIDDFAHHPTAVRETLAALKAAYPISRLVAVFEPRTNSSRRAVFQQDYAKAFFAADAVLLREPLPLAGVAAEELFSSAQLAADLRRNGMEDVHACPDTDSLLEHLGNSLVAGDVVAILSNGGFDNIHVRLLELLGKR